MSLLANLWGLITLASFIWVVYDVLTKNRSMNDIMKIMWIVVLSFSEYWELYAITLLAGEDIKAISNNWDEKWFE